MNERLIEAILDGGGGLRHLQRGVVWLARREATQQEIADAMGVDIGSANRWARDPEKVVDRLFLPRHLAALAETFDISYHALLAYTGQLDGDLLTAEEVPPMPDASSEPHGRSRIKRPRP